MAHDLKGLMGLTQQELIGIGEQYGLTFHANMRKSDMASQISQSAASGWLEVNKQLLDQSPDDDYSHMVGYGGDESMLSDSARAAQMLAGAGMAQTFRHYLESGGNKHLETVNAYLSQLGANSDEVLLHLPRSNPNQAVYGFHNLREYMRDTLVGHQDIMPQIHGHYESDILSEYSTSHGNLSASYENIAHMYLDKGMYDNASLYQHDVAQVAQRLAIGAGPRFMEVAAASALGAPTSYLNALPQLGDPSITGHVAYPRQPLNAAGLPLSQADLAGPYSSHYSLGSSLTGLRERTPGAKAAVQAAASAAKEIAQIYTKGGATTPIFGASLLYGTGTNRTDVGMNPYGVETSEMDMIMDLASRRDDIEDVRSAYSQAYEPSYSLSSLKSILRNSADVFESDSVGTSVPVSNYSDQSRYDIRPQGAGNSFLADLLPATDWNPARARRESIAIANLDSSVKESVQSEAQTGPVFHSALQQGSQEWHDFRSQYDITGSTVGSYLGNNRYTSPVKEMSDKLFGVQKASNFDMERGHRLEPIARQRVAEQYGLNMQEVGAITNPAFPRMMYSPDALIGDDAIWEHKAPRDFFELSSHPDYMDQMQLGMAISGRSRALFSQTVGSETRSEWVDQDPSWLDRNRTKLESTMARMDAGRRFVEEHSELEAEKLKNGARSAMTGSGIWGFQTNKSGGEYYTAGKRGMSKYSPSAGTSSDEFIINNQANEFSSDEDAYRPNWTSGGIRSLLQIGHNPDVQSGETVRPEGNMPVLAEAVKTGILAAQEESKLRRGSTFDGESSRIPDPMEPDEDFPDSGGGRRRGGGGGGGRPPSSPIGFDYTDPFGRIAAGIAGGSLSSAAGGAMSALTMTPWGRAAAVGIGAIQIGNEAAESLNNFAGTSLDYGLTNPNAFSSMSQGMEMLGASSEQASQLNRTTHSAYNTLLNGDPSGAIRIVSGSRGLLNISDIRDTGGDPVALNRLFQQRAKDRGWTPERIAGAAQMAGLDGFARGANATDYSHSQAEEVVRLGRESDTANGTAQLERLQVERARALPGYNVPQTALSNGGNVFAAGADAVTDARYGIKSVHDFIAGEESGGREYNPDGSRVTSPTGARGIMQVLPSTAGNPGFGIRPSDGSPEDDARVGREYYDTMLNRYGGDSRKAMAAYTDGPATVDNAVSSNGDNWLNVMPSQARNRVAAYDKWVTQTQNSGLGAEGFTRSGLSYGQTSAPTIVQVNIDAKVNNQNASATVSTPNGQTATTTINMNNGVNQRR